MLLRVLPADNSSQQQRLSARHGCFWPALYDWGSVVLALVEHVQHPYKHAHVAWPQAPGIAAHGISTSYTSS